MQSYSTLKAVTTRATVSGLKPGTRYMFQVRARTSAGCGRFSQAMEVETGKPRECRERGGRELGQARRRGRGGQRKGMCRAGACAGLAFLQVKNQGSEKPSGLPKVTGLVTAHPPRAFTE